MSDILIIHESALLPQILASQGKEVKAFMGTVSKQFHEGRGAKHERSVVLNTITSQAKAMGANAIIIACDESYTTAHGDLANGWYIAGNAVLLEDVSEDK